ncbi:3-phosphoserine/phosphohydroxythreonine transaminase [Azoarcus taiwanensis]|uniref:Phosphoserine aminotransferase n=1 Tax=Azoarcus taiwanensis TaxID=666964 RepID=A0A972F885_9RHOO|nr:3-phosphoserine/phosphohydroxythreonine transaminase [Azoarcus taiwanensis]NMG03814.1 3-phosphoserine/phosphohydroxythreonine transaminase [Azoarcus taiwanensis]
MSRVFNFSAGPAALPESVLRQAADEMLEWNGAGCGVMEMSHRGAAFTSIVEAAEQDLRDLLAVPKDYRVLFLQGGATQQFAQIPMNLLDGGKASYVVTGAWSRKAVKEAERMASAIGGRIELAVSTEAHGFRRFAAADEISLRGDEAYLHVCTNETIHGIECFDFPALAAHGVPVVADMSSHILSRPFDLRDFGLIYAGAQKNIGPSGLTVVIVRESLLGRAWAGIPQMLDYKVMADNGSMLNTPPTYGIYIAGLVFRWLKEQGGLAAMEARNKAKASALYDFIDGNDFYRNEIDPASRSRMNVPFRLREDSLDKAFLADAEAAGLAQLKGHKSVGGMRASIYNAMPLEGVQALMQYMDDFARRHG